MKLLTDTIKEFVANTQLCYVAIVDADHSPNLSPKGSLQVLDDEHLVFANIASPQTIENLHERPLVEVNVVDVFKRRGYGFKGTAQIQHPGTNDFNFVAKPLWASHGKALPVHHIVKIKVDSIRPFHSPAYTYKKDITEASLVKEFMEIYTNKAKTE